MAKLETAPLQGRGNRLMKTVPHPAEKNRHQKVMSSIGEWNFSSVINSVLSLAPPPLLWPFLGFSLTQPLDSSLPHSPFPTIEPLADFPMHSVSDEGAES